MLFSLSSFDLVDSLRMVDLASNGGPRFVVDSLQMVDLASNGGPRFSLCGGLASYGGPCFVVDSLQVFTGCYGHRHVVSLLSFTGRN